VFLNREKGNQILNLVYILELVFDDTVLIDRNFLFREACLKFVVPSNLIIPIAALTQSIEKELT